MMQLGKYQLISKLATGGMAEVYLSRIAGPGDFEKTLVLKRILPHLAEEHSFVEMFLSEAKLAARLEHPNIVQIFDFGQEEGTYYLAMEYIDGLNLRVLLKKARQQEFALPPALCARIITGACEGLAYAHERTDNAGAPLQLVHRDISPDNLMLSRQGIVKVVDFGIAKATTQSHRTLSGLIRGKLSYLAPEQIEEQPLDRRVDVYALGVVLYELLTGARPFQGDSEVSIMNAILTKPLVPASQRRSGLPPELLLILDRALARGRDQRYPDCRALQADLERFLMSTGEAVGPRHLTQLLEQVLGGDTLEESAPARPAASPQTVLATAPTSPGSVPEMRPPTTVALPAEASRSRQQRALVLGGAGAAALVLLGGLGAYLSRPSSAPPEPLAHAVLAIPPRAEVSAPSPETSAPRPETPAPNAEVPTLSEPAVELIPEPTEESTARAARPADMGTVEFRVRPYATVVIQGKSLGQTPLRPVQLRAGKYTVKLTNSELDKEATREIEVRAGRALVVKHDLLAP